MKEMGKIIILNGVPRSGKSSIVREIQSLSDEPWLNLGVDNFKQYITPEKFGPGLGMRPGANRPELETYVPRFFRALYASIKAHSLEGLNVVADLGHHDDFSKPLNILNECVQILEGLPVLFVGVKCPIEIIMERRNRGEPGREGVYATSSKNGEIPESVHIWQRAVHTPGIYDLEVDTSILSTKDCAEKILQYLTSQKQFIAFEQLRGFL